ncbi:phosphoprotein [Lone star tick rhabdovirus]|uniref:Phosphoprotein n=1 Tax=Lone star tick rhabdovirus TaxID=1756186 RepID=A0A1N7TF62_9RHAB|nr:phosphoprotein [Lone star tick rhabdovirus]ALO28652.1 phosphoprotein [Lone star tick rhabdovirus]
MKKTTNLNKMSSYKRYDFSDVDFTGLNIAAPSAEQSDAAQAEGMLLGMGDPAIKMRQLIDDSQIIGQHKEELSDDDNDLEESEKTSITLNEGDEDTQQFASPHTTSEEDEYDIPTSILKYDLRIQGRRNKDPEVTLSNFLNFLIKKGVVLDHCIKDHQFNITIPGNSCSSDRTDQHIGSTKVDTSPAYLPLVREMVTTMASASKNEPKGGTPASTSSGSTPDKTKGAYPKIKKPTSTKAPKSDMNPDVSLCKSYTYQTVTGRMITLRVSDYCPACPPSTRQTKAGWLIHLKKQHPTPQIKKLVG